MKLYHCLRTENLNKFQGGKPEQNSCKHCLGQYHRRVIRDKNTSFLCFFIILLIWWKGNNSNKKNSTKKTFNQNLQPIATFEQFGDKGNAYHKQSATLPELKVSAHLGS